MEIPIPYFDSVHYSDLLENDVFYDSWDKCFYKMKARDESDIDNGIFHMFNISKNIDQSCKDPGYKVYRIGIVNRTI